MKRSAKNCPSAAWGYGPAGGDRSYNNSSQPCRRKQLALREMKKPLLRWCRCSFCGELKPESELVGRDRSLLFCDQCVTALDALCDGADDALAVFRRTS